MRHNLLLTFLSFLLVMILFVACDEDMPIIEDPFNMDTMQMPIDTNTIDTIINPIDTTIIDTIQNPLDSILADIVDVSIEGDENLYIFSVGIYSPDIDCDQYANWWEVVTLEGELVYRRILNHSHADEQPFIRSGGPVVITADTEVYIRAWMHPNGFGGKVFKGSPNTGFVEFDLVNGFADELGNQEPLPDFCLY